MFAPYYIKNMAYSCGSTFNDTKRIETRILNDADAIINSALHRYNL